MVDYLESPDSDLESIKRLLKSKCWTEDETISGGGFNGLNREELFSLCSSLRRKVLQDIEKINDSTPFGDIKNIFIRLSTINGCIFLFKVDELEPIILSGELQKLSIFVLNANRVSEEIERNKGYVLKLVG